MKARTKARKLADKRKRQAKGLPEIARIPKRQARHKGRFVKVEKDPRRTVLDARCRQMGRDSNKKRRSEMTDPMMGDPAGQAISIGSRNAKEARTLWETFEGLDKADARYHARILVRPRHAKCGKVEYMPERFEARADDQSDPRAEDEKDRDAVSTWMRWHGYLGHMASHEQSAIWDGVYLRCEMHKTGTLTTAGKAFVAAMRVLSGVLSKVR